MSDAENLNQQASGEPSLQKWGRLLPDLPEVLDAAATRFRREEAELQAIVAAIGKVETVGDDELPADKQIIAQINDIRAALNRITSISAILARAARSADSLTPLYRRGHEMDEERLAGGRGGRHKEKRADVGTAEQDT